MHRKRALIVFAVLVVFLAISGELARFFATESDERGKVLNLLEAQARGDAGGMFAQLAPSCRTDARCRAKVTHDAARLRRPGEPKIIAYDSKTAYVLGARTGLTRVAWTVVDHGLPVVQCVVVRRDGNALAGRRVTLLYVSAPIGNESTC